MANRINELAAHENRLGGYLKDRRTKLDPFAFGLPADRRRTPGLRREEVAQRANISPTWYTWLEQGRGGAPSADVLDRIARALMLTDVEREHLFLIGLGRPPEARYQKNEGVTPRLQRVLDALEPSPALIRTATWDVIAWNRAAAAAQSAWAAAAEGLPPAKQLQVLALSQAQLYLGDCRRRRTADLIYPLLPAFLVSLGAGALATVATGALKAMVTEFMSGFSN